MFEKIESLDEGSRITTLNDVHINCIEICEKEKYFSIKTLFNKDYFRQHETRRVARMGGQGGRQLIDFYWLMVQKIVRDYLY